MSKITSIPILDLKKEYKVLKESIDKHIKDCFSSQEWVLGKKVTQFEKEVSKYLKVKQAIGVASGTDALIISLSALAQTFRKKPYFDKKDEIITTPFTFIATVESIIRSGATPVLVDIDPDTFNISPQAVKKAVNKNTVGIIPVHLYGLSCYMGEILKIARENKLFVVEDSAQSFGGTYCEKKLGTLGDCGAFSFFPSKNLGGWGDGGLVVAKDQRLSDLIRALRNHGQTKQYEADYLGYNSRLDAIQAAVLLAKLKYLDRFNKLRQDIAHKYNRGFANLKGLSVPVELEDSFCVYHLYTIKVSQNRDELLRYLNSKGIGARVYYPKLISQMKAFRGLEIKDSLKNAKSIPGKVLSLPIHPFLTEQQVQKVIKTVLSFFKK